MEATRYIVITTSVVTGGLLYCSLAT